jgi:hypothetical protein
VSAACRIADGCRVYTGAMQDVVLCAGVIGVLVFVTWKYAQDQSKRRSAVEAQGASAARLAAMAMELRREFTDPFVDALLPVHGVRALHDHRDAVRKLRSATGPEQSVSILREYKLEDVASSVDFLQSMTVAEFVAHLDRKVDRADRRDEREQARLACPHCGVIRSEEADYVCEDCGAEGCEECLTHEADCPGG